ncbi:hypothetical protein LM99_0061A [Enterococcus phage vB_EfaS_LM99]|nr:hypothetical protein LM99_0061A [Enterococcus phage vB_EfaS_LM99]
MVPFQLYQTFHRLLHRFTITNYFPHKQHKNWFLKQHVLCYNFVREFFLNLNYSKGGNYYSSTKANHGKRFAHATNTCVQVANRSR